VLLSHSLLRSAQALKKKTPVAAPAAAEKKEEGGATQVDFRAQALKNKVAAPTAAKPDSEKKEDGPAQVDFRYFLSRHNSFCCASFSLHRRAQALKHKVNAAAPAPAAKADAEEEDAGQVNFKYEPLTCPNALLLTYCF